MIRSYLTVLRFEVSKAIASRGSWVAIVFPAVLAALTAAWVYVQRGVESALTDEFMGAPSAFAAFSRGAGSGFVLGAIMILLYSSMIFSNEGGWKTYKVTMLRPCHRLDWVAAKMTLLGAMVAALIISVSLAAWAVSASLGDFAAIEEEGFVFLEAREMRRETLLAIALTAPPLLALAAFGMTVSTFTDHAGVAASTALGIFIVLETAKESMDQGRLFLFNTFLPSLIDRSYFDVLKKLAQGYLDEPWEDGVMIYAVLTPLITTGVCLLIASAVFGRREFTT